MENVAVSELATPSTFDLYINLLPDHDEIAKPSTTLFGTPLAKFLFHTTSMRTTPQSFEQQTGPSLRQAFYLRLPASGECMR